MRELHDKLRFHLQSILHECLPFGGAGSKAPRHATPADEISRPELSIFLFRLFNFRSCAQAARIGAVIK